MNDLDEKRTYIARSSSWDTFFATIAMDMESSFIDKEIRQELSEAYKDIKEVVQEDILDDIERIVNHYHYDELNHFQESDEDEADVHIYHTLEKLRNFLLKQ